MNDLHQVVDALTRARLALHSHLGGGLRARRWVFAQVLVFLSSMKELGHRLLAGVNQATEMKKPIAMHFVSNRMPAVADAKSWAMN